MSTFAKAAPFIDAPFVFKGIEHMNKVVEANILAPIADEVAAKAEVVLIGYAGGGIRNIFANKPLRNLADHQGPQGARAGRADLVEDVRGRRHVARPSLPIMRSTTPSRMA